MAKDNVNIVSLEIHTDDPMEAIQFIAEADEHDAESFCVVALAVNPKHLWWKSINENNVEEVADQIWKDILGRGNGAAKGEQG